MAVEASTSEVGAAGTMSYALVDDWRWDYAIVPSTCFGKGVEAAHFEIWGCLQVAEGYHHQKAILMACWSIQELRTTAHQTAVEYRTSACPSKTEGVVALLPHSTSSA